ANPATVARRVAAATAGKGTLVKNIRDQGVDVVSPITAVDLHGISRIEGAFALLLAAAALALYVAVAVAERRQEFATMSALGTRANRILSFVWSEVALIVGAAAALAALLGWLLAVMLVAMLQHAFDPPPDHLAVPWTYFAGLAAATLFGAGLATLLAARAIRRLPLGSILREE
ncbi:MAG: putative transport system permease protein, partial [Gaiellaceae bacterium]|nr:putative transport system permease protein [Gaiellaceae bacterium]